MQRDVWRIGLNYAEQQRDPAKHAVGIGVVIVMHVILGYALLNGLARTVIDVIKGPIETKIIEEAKPPPPPPENLPPPPKFAPPPPSFVPPPEVVINAPPTPAPTITTTAIAPPPTAVVIAPPQPEAPPAPARVAPVAAITNVADCKPTYPAAAVKADATGTTKIRFTIDASGKLIGAVVLKSAGLSRAHKELDRAAVSGLSECVFRPGRDENGKAVGAFADVEYVWKLN